MASGTSEQGGACGVPSPGWPGWSCSSCHIFSSAPKVSFLCLGKFSQCNLTHPVLYGSPKFWSGRDIIPVLGRHWVLGDPGFRSWQGICPMPRKSSIESFSPFFISCSLLPTWLVTFAYYSCFNKFLSSWHLFDLIRNSFPISQDCSLPSGLRFA